MREIRFRIWDAKDKIMCNVYQMEYFDKAWWAHCLPHNSDNTRRVLSTVHNPLMQFTGLRDAKCTEEYPEGQPICEGDILSITCYSYRECENEYYGEVVIGQLVGVGLIYTDHTGKKICEPLWNLTGTYKTEYYVCGNVHEHPHILGGNANA